MRTTAPIHLPRPIPGGRFSKPAVVLASLFILTLAAAPSWYYFRQVPAERANYESMWSARLSGVLSDRRAAIESWVADGVGDVRTLASFPSVIALLANTPSQVPGPALGESLGHHTRDLLDIFVQSQRNQAAVVLDRERRIASATTQPTRSLAAADAAIQRVLRGGAAGVDMVVSESGSRHVVFVAPVLAQGTRPDGGRVAIGVVLLETDPETWLYPLLERQPTPSGTGEVVLVRRQGPLVEFLSPLRKLPETRVPWSPPPDPARRAARAALSGEDRFGTYRDYISVDVLAASGPVPGTNWALIAKIDRAEALEPFDRNVRASSAALFGVLGGFGAAIFGLWRLRQTRYVASLAQVQARFAQLFEQANDAVFIVSGDGRVLDVNRRAEEIYGYSHDQFLRMTVVDFRTADQVPHVADTFARAMTVGSMVYETRHVRHDGTDFPVEVSIRKVRLENEEALLSIIRDVSERHEATRRIEQQRAYYERILESAADGIGMIGPGHRIEYVNQALARIAGIPREQIVGVNLLEGFPRASLGEFVSKYLEAVQSLRALRYEGIPLTTPAGRSSRQSGWLIPVVRDNRFDGMICTTEDVTEQARLEEQLRQAQKMEAVGRLAGGIAHDFNNLLTAIGGYADLALMDVGEQSRAGEHVAEIKRAADRAASLTRQLLAFSRRQMLQPRVLDLNQVVSSIEKMLRRLIGEDIELAVTLGDQLGTVTADPGQLEQVLLNLAVNARDAMPDGGSLRIATRHVNLPEAIAREGGHVPAGAYISIEVSDSGRGMAPDVLAHVFEPFFTTKEMGQGTGLGLSTVYGIVEQSGGHILVTSTEGVGTTFTILLPRTEGPVDERRSQDAPAPDSRGNETVLVVEDNTAVHQLVDSALSLQGYHVIVAEDAAAALAALAGKDDTIQLLLTDVVLPGMTGRDLARHASARYPGLRVIYMSGYADDAVVRQGIAGPGVAFVQKPFTAAEIAGRVRQVLDGPPPAIA